MKSEWLRKQWKQIVVVVAALAAVGGLFGKVEAINKAVNQAFRVGVIVAANGSFQGFHTWFVLLVTLVLLLSIILGWLLWQAKKEIVGELEKTRKTLDGAMRSAREIRERHFPKPALPTVTYRRIKRYIYVCKGFDGQSYAELSFEADSQDLTTLEVNVGVEEQADPVRFLEDIDFAITDSSRADGLVYLQVQNEDRSKKIIVFPLPALKKGEQRALTYGFTWPGMFKRLKETTEDCVMNVKSAQPVDEIEIGVFLDPKLERQGLTVDKVGNHAPTAKLEDGQGTGGPHPNWRGRIYKATSVTYDEVTLRISVR